MRDKLTLGEFIERSNVTHGYKYDYSKSIYTKSKDRIIVICPKHGEFTPTAINHMRKQGCPVCTANIVAQKATKDTNVFISEANKIHGNKYDYSKTIYTKSSDKVIITCPIHGDFEQNAGSHIRGTDCRKCSYINKISPRTRSVNQLIPIFNAIHDNKFDYSLVVPHLLKDKIKIICPIHGIFEQVSHAHMLGSGCYRCGREFVSELMYRKEDELILKIKEIHGDRYEYPDLKNKRNLSRIEIICKEHGSFFQQIKTHLTGCGCPKCGVSKNSFNKESWINKAKDRVGTFYILRCFNDNESFYKYGITYTGVSTRYISKKLMPYKYDIIRLIISTDKDYIWELERRFLKFKRANRYHPKIQFAGATMECFSTFTESNRH